MALSRWRLRKGISTKQIVTVAFDPLHSHHGRLYLPGGDDSGRLVAPGGWLCAWSVDTRLAYSSAASRDRDSAATAVGPVIPILVRSRRITRSRYWCVFTEGAIITPCDPVVPIEEPSQ